MRSHGLLNQFTWLSGGKLIHHCTMLFILTVIGLCAFTCEKFLLSISTSEICEITRLCSSRARWSLAPNFCSWVTGKTQFFHRNHMLGTLDYTGPAPFSFSKSTSLNYVIISHAIFKDKLQVSFSKHLHVMNLFLAPCGS